jgi:cephalosporin hydroxylase/glycosyltransferase involved in cell wall biosynthesis
MLSVIIPAKNEKYLEATIKDILANAEGEIEVIAELDGYIPDPQIVIGDSRVTFIYHKESIGQRACINHGVSIAKGTFIMKCDAHCAFDKGFDVKLAADCEESWTVIPRMYNLDVEAWKPKKHKLTDYMYISSPDCDKPFRAEYYTGAEYRAQHSKKALIDDTMACMGPCWFMHKSRFLEQGGCDEAHGSWGAQSVEVSCKAWLSGGSLKVNKKTWFAHWFRGGIGFPYEISGRQVEIARSHSRDIWLNNKWDKAVRDINWMVEKFRPPTWETNVADVKELNKVMYQHIMKGRRYPRWRGQTVLKMPSDFLLYHQVIHENKPDFIIETGTKYGGSAMFFADMCELNGKGQVISIDIKAIKQPKHPRITYLNGSSVDKSLVEEVKKIVGNGSVMVVLDSNHGRKHVKWELFLYGKLVTPGQYMVAEDGYSGKMERSGPIEAKEWYLKTNKRFEEVDLCSQFLVGLTRDGWLLRR